MMATPIFIISLPRSGSTLLQRLLVSSGDCSSYGEPSFLLRLLDGSVAHKRLATYSEDLVERAFSQLEDHYPGYMGTYDEGVRELASKLYDYCAGGNKYFIDKTPRYSLICSSLHRVFPNAKFIYLWRNPGAIINSMANTWAEGYWDVGLYKVDLVYGFKQMIDSYTKHRDQSISLRYEDLVSDSSTSFRNVLRYLDLNEGEDLRERDLAERPIGVLGDPSGGSKFKKVDGSQANDWRYECNNWYRRKLLKDIIEAGGKSNWEGVGYTTEELMPTHDEVGLLDGCLDATKSSISSLKMLLGAKRLREQVELSSFSTGVNVTYL